MTGARFRIAVLASGRGSNLQAIVDACADGSLAVEVVSVHSDRPRAAALQRACDAGITAQALRPSDYGSRSAFDAALFDQIRASRPDLIVCAGYMRLIDAEQVERHRGALINIHPSLLPAFKGLHTHQQALNAGAQQHGASVHFVTPELDGGPVIAQAVVPVHAHDSAPALAARVLEVEHPLLIETLRWLAAGRIALAEDGVHVDGHRSVPLQLAANRRFA